MKRDFIALIRIKWRKKVTKGRGQIGLRKKYRGRTRERKRGQTISIKCFGEEIYFLFH